MRRKLHALISSGWYSAGIVTAGYMDELKKEREENGKKDTVLAPPETDDKTKA